jgi:hypothetical protein
VNCPFDSHAKGVAEAAAKEALQNLNNLANEPYMPYLKLKLGEWQGSDPSVSFRNQSP